eukprot:gene731-10446_t
MFGKNVFHRSRSTDFEDSGSRRSSIGLARSLFDGMFSICMNQVDRNVVQPLVSKTEDEVQQEVLNVEVQCGKDDTASPKSSNKFRISTIDAAQEENNCDDNRSKNMMSKPSNPAYGMPEDSCSVGEKIPMNNRSSSGIFCLDSASGSCQDTNLSSSHQSAYDDESYFTNDTEETESSELDSESDSTETSDSETESDQHASSSETPESVAEHTSEETEVVKAKQIDIFAGETTEETEYEPMPLFDPIVDEEESVQKLHEYFQVQKLNINGLYKPGPIGSYEVSSEIKEHIDKAVEENEDTGVSTLAEASYHLLPEEDREYNNAAGTNQSGYGFLPIQWEQYDEEVEKDEEEYTEKRTLSTYDKYSQGQLYFNPTPMDDILEESNIDVTDSKSCWVFRNIASEYNADTLSAIVPFANEMKEEEREEYGLKDSKPLKRKIKEKFAKLKRFFTRKSRKVAPEPEEQEDSEEPEMFLLRFNGEWNYCYEDKILDEETGDACIVSIGQYEYPDHDHIRKRVVMDPKLGTIEEEDDEFIVQ